ncbi:hypothetical protein [Aquibacillus rhizosphaerae]|uniref:Uncharacterized protein n=1 Tax=Aquibacillus rhizosphaerae TaxID=3051431 RepID=A0ABT7L6P1_9BACI|nr:hypothetical protein [Aquibacillus sp. LR5S19]MDL4840875.1 hypothetical protein [Aquibacillus sp. LR5S19]
MKEVLFNIKSISFGGTQQVNTYHTKDNSSCYHKVMIKGILRIRRLGKNMEQLINIIKGKNLPGVVNNLSEQRERIKRLTPSGKSMTRLCY